MGPSSLALRVHPVAALLPMMEAGPLAELAEDIRVHGQRRPCYERDGELVDGRNRTAACALLNRAPWIEPLPAEVVDVVAFIESENLRRRDLTLQARAFFAVGVRDYRAAAAARQAASRAQPGQQVGAHRPAPRGAGLAENPAEFPRGNTPASDRGWADDAAEKSKVGSRTLERVDVIVHQAIPEIVQVAKSGELAIKNAEVLARMPLDEQRELVRKGVHPEILAEVARETAKKRKEEAAAVKAGKIAAATKIAADRAPPVEGIEWLQCSVAEGLGRIDPGSIDFISADAPWKHDNKGNGAAATQYPLMEVPEIVADLGASYELAARDSYLVTWVSLAHLEEYFYATFEAGRRGAWAWEYSSAGGQAKTGQLGIGMRWRGHLELALLYVKGEPRVYDTIRNVVIEERGDHSEKSLEFSRSMVRAFSPGGGRILDLYSGRAPLARAVLSVADMPRHGAPRSYRGIELLQTRIDLARAALDDHRLSLLSMRAAS